MPFEVAASSLGYKIIAADADLPQLASVFQFALITVGQIKSPDNRIRLYQQAIKLGLQFPVIVSPKAYVSRHATIGAGTIVMNGASIGAGARVGNNCIINTRSLVEHDSTVEDHCHISTGAILNGNVKVGTGSFVGSGSIIKEGVTLGERCLIGMGLSVRHDQARHARFAGHEKT